MELYAYCYRNYRHGTGIPVLLVYSNYPSWEVRSTSVGIALTSQEGPTHIHGAAYRHALAQLSCATCPCNACPTCKKVGVELGVVVKPKAVF